MDVKVGDKPKSLSKNIELFLTIDCYIPKMEKEVKDIEIIITLKKDYRGGLTEKLFRVSPHNIKSQDPSGSTY